MKKFIALIGYLTLLFITPLAHSQTVTNTPDQTQSISNVLLKRLSARLISARITIDDGKIVAVQLHPIRYMKLIQQIDTTGCPQDFRLAWLDYVQTWQRRTNPRVITENVLEGLPALHGNFSGLNDIGKRMESDDTLIPWQKCVRVALQYGVDASKVKLH